MFIFLLNKLYNGDLKSDHLKSILFVGRISNGLVFKWFMKTWQPFIQTSNNWASRFYIPLEIWTICNPTPFRPFKIQTSPDFRSLLNLKYATGFTSGSLSFTLNKYSGHLNSEKSLVPYSNSKVFRLVRPFEYWKNICLVFRYHLITKPFGNQTTIHHLNAKQEWTSWYTGPGF